MKPTIYDCFSDDQRGIRVDVFKNKVIPWTTKPTLADTSRHEVKFSQDYCDDGIEYYRTPFKTRLTL